MKIKYQNLSFQPKEINEENNTIRAVFSTDDVDRHGEVVDQKSWLLDDFMKNPVVLFGHDHYSPPVGMVTGLGYNEDGNLEGEIKFAANEYPFAKVIWNLYKGGFMKAFSVGFSSGRVDVVDDQLVLRDNTLYEVSTVGVPANAMALAKSKGIDTNPLEEKYLEQEKTEREKAEAKAEETEEEETTKCESCEKEIEDSEKGCPCKEKPAEEETEEEIELEEAPEEEKQKGEVEDAVDEQDERERKWENMDPVFDIFHAFIGVYMDPDTSADDFSKLLKETGELFVKHAEDPDSAKEAIDAFTKSVDTSLLQKLMSYEENSEDTEKAIGEFVDAVKEGKVLSKANRTKVQNAVEALQTLLDADNKDDKSISENNTDDFIKVETPAVRISVPKKGHSKNRAINKAVRALLAEKQIKK